MKRWMLAAVLGAGVAVTGCANMHGHHGDEEDEGDEVKISLNQVPAAARATLEREANGAAISSVDKETKDGKVVYETDVMLNGHNWEIKVDPDGKLIHKKIDEEEGEKKGKKEKDED